MYNFTYQQKFSKSHNFLFAEYISVKVMTQTFGLEGHLASAFGLIDSQTGKGVSGEFSLLFRILSFSLILIMIFVNSVLGRKTGAISNHYNLNITPPGPFFAIWGVIFIGLIVAGVYNLSANVWSLKVHILFAISNILNSLWVLVFKNGTKTTNNICFVILFFLFLINQQQWVEMGNLHLKNESQIYWNHVCRNIFAFYQGWLTGAVNLNLGLTLVYSMGISKKTQAIIFWVLTPSCAIFLTYLNVFKIGPWIDALGMFPSLMWALSGAAISTVKNYNKKDDQKELLEQKSNPKEY